MTTNVTFAIRFGQFCTVETDNGQIYIGTVSQGADGTVIVKSGMPGKPAILDIDSIVEILSVDESNPHIDR